MTDEKKWAWDKKIDWKMLRYRYEDDVLGLAILDHLKVVRDACQKLSRTVQKHGEEIANMQSTNARLNNQVAALGERKRELEAALADMGRERDEVLTENEKLKILVNDLGGRLYELAGFELGEPGLERKEALGVG
jgi:chromosome segregation ATPase